MGVAGLWEVLRPAGNVRSLTELAVVSGFNTNPHGQRGFRIGIDASIWFFHAAYGREGENPELRTLFFRCCRLLQSPLLPLFVFDGPNRPAIKRGKRVGGNQHWLTQGMKNIIDAFGFEWWVAPGEAEAELAYLNRVGIIDAVLSDDVDNFLFGATMVIRNPSNTLSGNRAHPVMNAQGKDDGNHVVTYTADAILSNTSVALSRPGTILIGLLSGGDYIPAGLPGCGQKFATGLARAGFGDSLLKAVKTLKGSRLDAFLDEWRQNMRNELKTNKSGLLPSKKPSLAASLPDDFPSLPVLMSYADPITSENTSLKGKRKTPSGVWRGDPDPMKIAALCELYFEWGVKDVIVQRFRTVLWPGIICRAVRRVVLDQDTRRRLTLVSTCHKDSEEEGDDTVSPCTPTKQISSALSSLALSSPSKKSFASTPSTNELFTLSSLVPLTSTSHSSSSSSTPSSSSPLLLEVVSQRTHASTDSILEYRVLIDPTALVERAESGVKGLRPPLIGGLFGTDPEDDDDDDVGTLDPDADESDDDAIGRLETAASKSGVKRRKARREVPTTPLRLWLPACMVRTAAPVLAEVYEDKVRVREEKRAKRGNKGVRGGRAGGMAGEGSTSRRARAKDVVGNDGDEPVPGSRTSKATGVSKSRAKYVGVGGGRGRRRAKQASEAQNDAYELIDLSAGEGARSESDGEDIRANIKSGGRTKAKNNVASRTATGTHTVKDFYKTTKSSSTVRATKTKPPKACTQAVPSRPVYEEEEDSTDVVAPPPLPKSSRPLDLLRAKRKAGAAAPGPISKSKSMSTTVARYEEEESSSSSSPPGSSTSKPSLPLQSGQPAAQPRKKPLFVDVSDTDSEIEVSDPRCSPLGATGTIDTHEKGRDGDASSSVGIGKSLRTHTTQSRFMAVDGVIDLTAKGKASRSNSIATTSIPARRLSPAHIGKGTGLASGTISDAILSTPAARSLSKSILPRPALESEEEEGDESEELPMFHRGSMTEQPSVSIPRPVPRPFPMQLASDMTVPPPPMGLGKRNENKHDDGSGEHSVEIVDVFTTPRSPLPPRSPTSSPLSSPLERLYAAAIVKCREFLDNLTESESRGQRRQASSDSDTRRSGNDGNSILKSPRKSAAHSSPRYVRTHKGASSSISSTSSNIINDALWPRVEDSGLSSMGGGDGMERKPRPSDASAIYISSGSEEEGDIGFGVNDGGGGYEAEVSQGDDQDQGQNNNQDQDTACADLDGDGWADTAMILSAPPSPALTPPARHLVSDTNGPVVKTIPSDPMRASKFRPARADVRPPLARAHLDLEVSGSSRPASMLCQVSTNDRRRHEETTVPLPRPLPVRQAPLLVARAKRCMDQGAKDVIDLTSDS